MLLYILIGLGGLLLGGLIVGLIMWFLLINPLAEAFGGIFYGLSGVRPEKKKRKK